MSDTYQGMKQCNTYQGMKQCSCYAKFTDRNEKETLQLEESLAQVRVNEKKLNEDYNLIFVQLHAWKKQNSVEKTCTNK